MSREATKSAAIAAGFVRRVQIDGECASFEALINPGADLDGTFEAFDTDNLEWLAISGWLLDSCEDLDTAEEIQKMDADALADLYVRWIGYNPFADDAATTVEEVRQTLVEYSEILKGN